MCDFVHSPIINSAIRSLGALYRYEGKNEAAEIMEEYAMRTHKPVSVTSIPSLQSTSEKSTNEYLSHMTRYFLLQTFVPNDRSITNTHHKPQFKLVRGVT